MGIKRVVDTEFWTHPNTEDFTSEDMYFMQWLLTNPFTTQLGIYSISLRDAANQLRYSKDALLSLLERFQDVYGVIVWSPTTKEIAIKNFLRHSIIKGGKPVEDCIKKEMTKVKNRNLIYQVFDHISDREDLNETVRKIISEYESEIVNENDNDNEVPSNDSSPIREIVAYLNMKTGYHYKHTTNVTRTKIEARIKEGFTLEDFKKVIDKKVDEWKGTEWEKFLRPETLFGSKFEGYLNTDIVKEKKPSSNKFNNFTGRQYSSDQMKSMEKLLLQRGLNQ